MARLPPLRSISEARAIYVVGMDCSLPENADALNSSDRRLYLAVKPWFGKRRGASVMRILYAVMLVAIGVAPASAQYEPLHFAICQTITSDAARLKCFDDMSKDPKKSVDPGYYVVQKPKWITNESKSLLDGSPQFSALTVGTPNGAALMLRCQEHQTQAYLVYPPTAALAPSANTKVEARIGELPPFRMSWSPSMDAKAVFASAPADFIKALRDNETLRLRIDDGVNTSPEFEFYLSSVSAIRERIAANCKWRTSKHAAAAPTHFAAGLRPWLQPSVGLHTHLQGVVRVVAQGRPGARRPVQGA